MRASSAKIIYSYPESDIVHLVKTTTYNKNNNIQWYFHIFKVQKSSKSDQTVQGIVQSGLLLLCTEFTLFCIELPENCIYLNHYEPSGFSKYFIRALTGQSYGTVHVSYLCNSEFAPFNLKTV